MAEVVRGVVVVRGEGEAWQGSCWVYEFKCFWEKPLWAWSSIEKCDGETGVDPDTATLKV